MVTPNEIANYFCYYRVHHFTYGVREGYGSVDFWYCAVIFSGFAEDRCDRFAEVSWAVPEFETLIKYSRNMCGYPWCCKVYSIWNTI